MIVVVDTIVGRRLMREALNETKGCVFNLFPMLVKKEEKKAYLEALQDAI